MHEKAFYVREGGRFVPTGLGTSPWNDNAQTGVSIAGLCGHLFETVASRSPMFTARLTIDILGAVPMEPLAWSVHQARDGRNFQVLQLDLSSSGRTWVRASALRVRERQSPEHSSPLERPRPEDQQAQAKSHRDWMEIVHLEKSQNCEGRGASWVRFMIDVVDGTPLSPLCAIAMAADFGSGTSPVVSKSDWTFANLDISVHLTRAPVGEWVLIDAITESAGNGAGLVSTRLGDLNGMVGMAHQTEFIQLR